VESYAKLGTPAVGPLIEILNDDATSLRTKRWVIAILGRMDDRDERITEAITKMLEHPNPYIQMAAKETLSMNFRTLLDDLENPKIPRNTISTPQQLKPQIVAETIKRLGELKDRRAIMPLINKLGEFDQILVDALERIGDLPVEPLAASLSQQDGPIQERYGFFGGMLMGTSPMASTRRRAAILLAFTEDKAAAVPYLIRCLEDDNIFVRIEATRSLGIIGSPAIDPLIEALSSEKLWVREGAVKALGAIRYSEGIDALLPLLQDESWYIRYIVGSTLAGEGKENALPRLKQALKKEVNPLVQVVLKKAKRDIRLRSLYRLLRISNSIPIG
jgi:HEAT repeat protein